MTGREIRAWAREWVKGLRRKLLLVMFLAGLPSFICSFIKSMPNVILPYWVTIPVHYLTFLLSIGLLFIAVDVIEGDSVRITELGTCFTKEMIGRALLLALLISVIEFIVNIGPTQLYVYAKNMIVNARIEHGEILDDEIYVKSNVLSFVSVWLSFILSSLSSIILFPVRYRLVLFPREGVLLHLKKGVVLGFHRFWRILSFLFWLLLPLPGIMFVLYLVAYWLMNTLTRLWIFLFLPTVGLIVFFCWYGPYMLLASAAFAHDLCMPEETPRFESGKRAWIQGFSDWLTQKEPEQRQKETHTMRLRAGGGGWYWCPMDRGPVWTETPVCRRRGKKG